MYHIWLKTSGPHSLHADTLTAGTNASLLYSNVPWTQDLFLILFLSSPLASEEHSPADVVTAILRLSLVNRDNRAGQLQFAFDPEAAHLPPLAEQLHRQRILKMGLLDVSFCSGDVVFGDGVSFGFDGRSRYRHRVPRSNPPGQQWLTLMVRLLWHGEGPRPHVSAIAGGAAAACRNEEQLPRTEPEAVAASAASCGDGRCPDVEAGPRRPSIECGQMGFSPPDQLLDLFGRQDEDAEAGSSKEESDSDDVVSLMLRRRPVKRLPGEDDDEPQLKRLCRSTEAMDKKLF